MAIACEVRRVLMKNKRRCKPEHFKWEFDLKRQTSARKKPSGRKKKQPLERSETDSLSTQEWDPVSLKWTAWALSLGAKDLRQQNGNSSTGEM